MALEVHLADDGSSWFSGVRDARDDPEGFVFNNGVNTEKIAAVETERMAKALARRKALGFVIQGE